MLVERGGNGPPVVCFLDCAAYPVCAARVADVPQDGFVELGLVGNVDKVIAEKGEIAHSRLVVANAWHARRPGLDWRYAEPFGKGWINKQRCRAVPKFKLTIIYLIVDMHMCSRASFHGLQVSVESRC